MDVPRVYYLNGTLFRRYSRLIHRPGHVARPPAAGSNLAGVKLLGRKKDNEGEPAVTDQVTNVDGAAGSTAERRRPGTAPKGSAPRAGRRPSGARPPSGAARSRPRP